MSSKPAPAAASASFMFSKTFLVCARRSPRPTSSAFSSSATWPEMKIVLPPPLTVATWENAGEDITPFGFRNSFFMGASSGDLLAVGGGLDHRGVEVLDHLGDLAAAEAEHERVVVVVRNAVDRLRLAARERDDPVAVADQLVYLQHQLAVDLLPPRREEIVDDRLQAAIDSRYRRRALQIVDDVVAEERERRLRLTLGDQVEPRLNDLLVFRHGVLLCGSRHDCPMASTPSA